MPDTPQPAVLPPKPPTFTPEWEPPLPFNHEEELEEEEYWTREEPIPAR